MKLNTLSIVKLAGYGVLLAGLGLSLMISSAALNASQLKLGVDTERITVTSKEHTVEIDTKTTTLPQKTGAANLIINYDDKEKEFFVNGYASIQIEKGYLVMPVKETNAIVWKNDICTMNGLTVSAAQSDIYPGTYRFLNNKMVIEMNQYKTIGVIMKKISKGYYIVSAILVIWAAVNFYDYTVVGMSLLKYYSGESIIVKLVRDSFFQGIIKMFAAAVILGIGFRRSKM